MTLADVVWAGAAAQAGYIRAGEISARELVEATVERIARIDGTLNAFRVVLADQALAEADRADARRRTGDTPPLLGVPVAIKDDTDVAGEVTAWGSAAHGPAVRADAVVVARLRAAGAIVIGKTHVPELTLWPWTSSATWGVTRNPWDTERTPGGSSGGSAVAVASGMCGVALGSDGGGSVRYPAALTGVFGIKPQRDRIPLGPGHHDAWYGLLAYGPLARSVRDAALFLDATADDRPAAGYLASLDAPPERLRIAVAVNAPPGSAATLTDQRRAAVEQTADLLRELGHEVVDHRIDYGLATLWSSTVRYLEGARHDAGSMPDRARLEPRTRRLATLGRSISDRSLRAARRREAAVAARINASFDHADVLLTPMTGAAAPRLDELPDRGVLRSLRRANVSAWAIPWNVIGQPAASVPAGLDPDGLPQAVQLCGRPDDELTILRLARQLEDARPWAHYRPEP